MKFLSATVVQRNGHPDCVSLTTDTTGPFDDETPLYLDFYTPANQGFNYVKQTFGLEAEVIKVEHTPPNF